MSWLGRLFSKKSDEPAAPVEDSTPEQSDTTIPEPLAVSEDGKVSMPRPTNPTGVKFSKETLMLAMPELTRNKIAGTFSDATSPDNPPDDDRDNEHVREREPILPRKRDNDFGHER